MSIPPGWFFATLAQITATTVGFIIAIITAVYATQRSQQRNRSERMISEINHLYREYYPPLNSINSEINKRIDTNLSEEENILDQCVSDDATEATITRYRVARIIHILQTYPQGTIQERAERVGLLKQNTMDLADDFSSENEVTKSVYEELTNICNAPENYLEKYIMEEQSHIEEWLKHKNYDENESTLMAWQKLFDDLRSDVLEIISRNGENLYIDLSDERDILRHSYIVFLTGVVIPIIFLLTSPQQFPDLTGYCLFGTELLVLGITLGGILCVFKDLYEIFIPIQ